MNGTSKKLGDLGIRLPTPAAAAGNYIPAKIAGGMLYLSGALPLEDGQLRYTGGVGETLTIAQGYEAARLCAINLLAAAQSVLGSLDKIVQIVSVRGYVSCGPGFTEQPAVINGASDLLVAIFGEGGRHVRAAVGVASLPKGSAVEVEMVAQISE